MRFYESRQSGTSPIRYTLELSLDEVKRVSTHLSEILCTLNNEEDKQNKKDDKIAGE